MTGNLPPIRVYFEENPYGYGPAGAKGIGELPTDGPARAILNAIRERHWNQFQSHSVDAGSDDGRVAD